MLLSLALDLPGRWAAEKEARIQTELETQTPPVAKGLAWLLALGKICQGLEEDLSRSHVP